MEVDGRESTVVPVSVMESVKRSLVHVDEIQTKFHDFLSLSDPDVLAQMPPLQRAESLLLLAKATTTLFTCKTLCSYFKQFLGSIFSIVYLFWEVNFSLILLLSSEVEM